MIAETMSRLPFLMPAGLAPKVIGRGIDNWYEQLVVDDAPSSAMKFFRWLDRHGRYRTGREMHRYAYGSIADIGEEIGVGEATIRCYAIPWLVENGWLAVEEVVIRGRRCRLWWCLWLLPFDQAGGEIDLGHGVMVPCGETRAPSRSPRRRSARAPRRAVFEADGAENGRPKTAPTNPDGLEDSNQEKTTTGGSVVVVEAAPGGEPVQDQEPPPAPPLAPELAELLERENAPELESRAREWCRSHPVERVLKAIQAGLKAAKNGKIRSTLVGYIRVTLGNMEREGPPPEVKAAPPIVATVNLPSPEQDLAARRERGALKSADASRRALWDALTADERVARLADARARAEVPAGYPPQFLAGFYLSWCLDELVRSGA